PLVDRDLSHVADRHGGGRVVVALGSAAEPDRLRNAVDDLVVPLVEDGELPVARWNAGEVEIPVLVALGEREVRAVRISEADVALGEAEAVARAAAVEPLVRHPAHARGGDEAFHFAAAGQAASPTGGGIAQARSLRVGPAVVDDLRVGESDGEVVLLWAEFR